jgi:hypothetical protein
VNVVDKCRLGASGVSGRVAVFRGDGRSMTVERVAASLAFWRRIDAEIGAEMARAPGFMAEAMGEMRELVAQEIAALELLSGAVGAAATE